MGKSIKIPGRLESAETGNIVAGANAIKDDTRGKTQLVVNNEVEAAILSLAENKQNVLTFDQTPTEDSTNPVTSGGVYAADKLLSDAIESILLLIPSAASSLNKLVDLATMNSSIATATASFKGTYNLVSDLHLSVDATHAQIAAALDALSLDADNNDYAFVQVPNTDTAPTEIKKTERYKFNGTNWAYEYDLNNSGFTSAQWNAINSGITALLVSKLSALPTNDALVAALATKQDNLTFDNTPTSGSNNPVKSGGIYTRNAEIVAMINDLDAAKQDVLTFDNTPTEGSSNPVKSGGVYLAISALQATIVALDNAKQNVLTFDSTPTLGSQNPVTSSGIKTVTNSLSGRIDTNAADIVILNNLYQALTQSALVVVQPTDTWPVGSPATSTIYRVVDRVNTPPQNYSDYMWNGSVMVLMATYDNAIDDVPTGESNNLVKSGGVFNDLSKYNRIGLTKYAGIVIANFNTGHVTGASETGNGYLVEVLPGKRYMLSSVSCLKYGVSSVQCYTDNPRTSASDKNLGRSYVEVDNTFVTIAGTKFVLISIDPTLDDGNMQLNFVDEITRTKLNNLTDFSVQAQSDIVDIETINNSLLDNLFGLYCTNFNIGSLGTADATHDGLLVRVKEGIKYLYTGSTLYGSVEMYSDKPDYSTAQSLFVGRVLLSYDINQGGSVFTAPQNAKYALFTINPTGYDFKAILKPSKTEERVILCYGDSLTQGGSETAGVSYPSVLQSRLGDRYKVYNKGVGGISSLAIMGVEGFAQMRIVGNNVDGSVTIPSDGTPVDVAGVSIQRNGTEEYEMTLPNNIYMFTAINNISLDGYENYGFALGWNSQTDKMTVRLTVGSPSGNITTSPRPRFTIYDIRQPEFKNPEIVILWMGTNGVWTNAEELRSQHEKMVTLYKTKNYFILGLTNTAIPLSTRVSIEKELEASFGCRFVNIREYLLNFGLRDADITPTAEDEAAIENGNIPPSLLVSDGIHFNDAGYTVIAGCLYNRFRQFGLL